MLLVRKYVFAFDMFKEKVWYHIPCEYFVSLLRLY